MIYRAIIKKRGDLYTLYLKSVCLSQRILESEGIERSRSPETDKE